MEGGSGFVGRHCCDYTERKALNQAAAGTRYDTRHGLRMELRFHRVWKTKGSAPKLLIVRLTITRERLPLASRISGARLMCDNSSVKVGTTGLRPAEALRGHGQVPQAV